MRWMVPSTTILGMTSPPALLVGAPVRNRGWIIGEWVAAVEKASWMAGVEPGFVMVGDPSDESLKYVETHCRTHDRFFGAVHVADDGRGDDPGKRTWNHNRYHHMVVLRNALLDAVRLYEPGAFLSLDTDILVHPEAIKLLSDALYGFDAVGGKAYMSHVGRRVPSHAFVRQGGGQTHRVDHEGGVVSTQVIMAIKMMSPDAYWVDYKWHHSGEDFGWSEAAREKGLRLGWDARVTNKHVMTPEMLTKVDKRCGY